MNIGFGVNEIEKKNSTRFIKSIANLVAIF